MKTDIGVNYLRLSDEDVKRGDQSSLRLLGRMNVNDDTTAEQLLAYLNRDPKA